MTSAMPATTDDRPSSYDYEELLACGRGELFGPGNAQLPLPPMLMFDRITAISEQGGEHGKGQVRAELDVTPELWFFGCHFKGDPVMPGCLGLDALWQMLGFFLGWLGQPGRGRALVAGRAEVLGHGPADRPAGGVRHRDQARAALQAGAGRRRRLAEGRRQSRSTRPRISGSACSRARRKPAVG